MTTKSNTIEVVKGGTETSMSLMRRFSKRVSGSGIVRWSRNRRYNDRIKSDLKTKREALKRLAKKLNYERLKKLGKIKDVSYKRN